MVKSTRIAVIAAVAVAAVAATIAISRSGREEAGEEATVESPTGAFAPFVVHYAETFIVPASVGKYVVRPTGPGAEKRHATMKAYVRT